MDNEKAEVEAVQMDHISRETETEDPAAKIENNDLKYGTRALLRKLDWRMMPLVSIYYLFSSLDRGNIGNARLGTFEKDLGFTGNDFYNALSVFYAGYVAASLPANLLMKKLLPSRLIGSTMILWGICSACMAATHNYGGVIALRFFLGIFESAAGPGTILFLSYWYLREELAMRVAIFFGSSTVAGAFGGAIAYGILGMGERQGLAPWRWLFIVEGLPTIVLGITCLLFLPDFPNVKTRFLTAEEKELAIQRSQKSHSADTKAWDRKQFLAGFKDYKNWMTSVVYIGLNVCLASYSSFLPTIVKDLGFSALNAQLLTIPPYAIACVVVFIVAWNADRTRQRGLHLFVMSWLGGIGYILLLATTNVGARYAGACIVACGIYPTIPLVLSWVTNNNKGATKRAVGVGLTNMVGQIFSTVGTQVYTDGPRYIRGHSVCLAMIVLAGATAFALRTLLKRENEHRDREYGHSGEWTEEKAQEAEDSDLYDYHPLYRYVL